MWKLRANEISVSTARSPALTSSRSCSYLGIQESVSLSVAYTNGMVDLQPPSSFAGTREIFGYQAAILHVD